METLRKLEQVQKITTIIQSQHLLFSPTPHSLRFLSHFLLFLMEPCGDLCLDDKCRLISQHLPTISRPSFVELALGVVSETQRDPLSDSPSVDQFEKNAGGNEGHELEVNFVNKDVALIGFDAMQRANSTLEDFCRSYFMFHRMDVKRPESVFKYLPLLSFTESYIYQLDSLNEKIVDVVGSTVSSKDDKSGEKSISSREHLLLKTFDTDPFQSLTLLLERHGLLTERIKDELKHGQEYWSLERKLCNALQQQKVEISVGDVMRAIHLKSFDYRVLNLLLYELRGQEVFFLVLLGTIFCLARSFFCSLLADEFCESLVKVNDIHMEFLSVSEFLVEISDDLFDYEEDVLENNFNILRMFIGIYGASAAPALAKCIAEAEEKYEELSKALDSELSSSYRKRCEEATREGGKISGHPLGSWIIPPLIIDEELYRSTLHSL